MTTSQKFWLIIPIAFLSFETFALLKDAVAVPEKTLTAPKSVIVKPSYKATTPGKLSSQGKVLFSQLKCASCHAIGDEGGCLGPPLAGIGAFRTAGYLTARLTDSKESEEKFQSEYSYHAELMPHPRFPSPTVQKLVAYLMTLSVPESGYQIGKHAAKTHTVSKQLQKKEATAADIAAGARNFYQFGCTACHSIGNVGGSLAPALDDIGSLRDLDYITDHITDAHFHTRMLKPDYESNPSKMPHFKASEKEIDQIASFLYTLKSKK